MSSGPQLVILGGGLRVLYRLRRAACRTIVDPLSESLNTPSCPQLAFAGRPISRTRFPGAPPVRRQGALLLTTAAERTDPGALFAGLETRQIPESDCPLVAVGAAKDQATVPGLAKRGGSASDAEHVPPLGVTNWY